MLSFCFQNEPRLADLIARSWRFECIEQSVRLGERPRLEILREAAQKPCVCQGKWKPAAHELFQQNALCEEDWCQAMLSSLEHGRQKGTLVCHVGAEGDEGKSFLLAPLPEVFGRDQVFTPVKGSFPLMGLEACRIALLDDWRFGEDILSYNVQLLWFEGKPIIIARPQNQCTGHLRYNGDEPIFISTLEANLMKVPRGLLPGDVAMMLKRLLVFRFSAKLRRPDRSIQDCGRCFAEFLFEGKQAARVQVGARAHTMAPPRKRSAEDAPVSNAKKQCQHWSAGEVAQWLDTLSLGHLSERFRENGVDGSFLAELSEDELRGELGLTRLQAKKIRSRWLSVP